MLSFLLSILFLVFQWGLLCAALFMLHKRYSVSFTVLAYVFIILVISLIYINQEDSPASADTSNVPKHWVWSLLLMCVVIYLVCFVICIF